jgi:hypothetical protein
LIKILSQKLPLRKKTPLINLDRKCAVAAFLIVSSGSNWKQQEGAN